MSSTSVVHTPPLVWAPRADRIYVSVEIPDATNVKVALQDEGRLKLSATSGDQINFELDLELFAEISTEKSKWKVTGRAIDLNIERKESGEFWPRLTKSNLKNRNIGMDWSRWIDEDDEDDQYDWHQSGGEANEAMNMEDFYLPPQEGAEEAAEFQGEEDEDEQPADLSDLDK